MKFLKSNVLYMPSISGTRKLRKDNHPQQRLKRTYVKSFVKGTNRTPTRRGKRQTASIIPVKTYSNKEETVDMEYRCLLDFSNMGGKNGSTPTLIRVNMNNPLIGGLNPSGNDVIVTCIQNTGTQGGDHGSPGTQPAVDPIYKRYANDNLKNLAERLKEYTDIYRDVVVLKSEAEVRIIPKLNPVNSANSINGRSVVNYWSNYVNTGDFAGLITPRLVLANALSEVDVWTIRQQAQGQLTNTGVGSPDLESLKANFPNLRMKRLNITPNTTKGVTFKQSYTPKSQYGFQSWKDNREQVRIFSNAIANPEQKESFMYVGIAGRYQSWSGDPADFPEKRYASDSITEVGLPLFKVEVKIKYKINFSQRLNIEGANEPTPHYGDL